MSEEIKFDLDGDIIMQIEMDSYMKYNDTIASMNDHLGEIYGYNDVKDMEEAQLKYEKELAYKAIKDLQQKVEQLEKENQKFFEELNTCMIERNSFLDKVEQLENIRKEVIEYCRSNEWAKDYKNSNCRTRLLNILNKGSDKDVNITN